MTVQAQDPNFDPMGHVFQLDPSIPPHGQHACTRCRIQAASFLHYPSPCPELEAPSEADPLEGLTGAESLGVLVTQAIHQAEKERDEARANLVRALGALSAMVSATEPNSFALTNATLDRANVILDELWPDLGVKSNQSPEQEKARE